jgi:Sec-independent protein translocase protein TatA
MSLSKMMFLGLIGLIFFGPKKLICVGQEMGKVMARLKKMSADFHAQLTTEITAASASSNPSRSILRGGIRQWQFLS